MNSIRLLLLTTLSLPSILLLMGCQKPAEVSRKFAIILQAGKENREGGTRALHALLYTQEFTEAGYDVVLIFDGAGTQWAQTFREPDHKLHDKFEKILSLGASEEICDYCAGAYDVKDGLTEMSDAPLVGEIEGHPSMKKWVDRGYQLIVL